MHSGVLVSLTLNKASIFLRLACVWLVMLLLVGTTPNAYASPSKQHAAFGEVVYHYFQEDYQQVLKLIEVANTQQGFKDLSQEDADRIDLMQGAAQLHLGMYQQSQVKFARLLSQTSSAYVQANTWFFMAKVGFQNKQASISEQAYKAILAGDLRDQLSQSQWHELLYLSAHTRMQLNQDWQSLAKQIPQHNIYSAYLLANHATMLFNEAQYDQATTSFMLAKKALIAHQQQNGGPARLASSVFDTISVLVTPWTWFDSNARAQRSANEQALANQLEEQDALFDRINIALGQSLLQQGDLNNAISVIQNVSEQGPEAQQALLSYGWANASENRWQNAMAAWQYLQQNSVGLFSLQASYGLAYAFSRQDNLGQAFYALQSTAEQLDTTLLALEDFAKLAQTSDFYSHYNERWPQALEDLKLSFFAPTQGFDAKYLLAMRLQAEQIKQDIALKQNRIEQLNTLLNEREAAYKERLQGMSLANAKARINQVQQHIDTIQTMLVSATSFEQELALSKSMTKAETRKQLERFNKASTRHKRLANDKTRKRPLKASYQERLKRIEGILKWQLMDDFIATRWAHQQLLKEAKDALSTAQLQYQQLEEIAQTQDIFSQQRAQFGQVTSALRLQINAAEKVYTSATANLQDGLLQLIEARRTQLKQQVVNTRLAMLRIQDLQVQGGQ